jgi:hypothetical protein
MRCCTYPPASDSILAKISVSLKNFEKPDTYIFGLLPKNRRILFVIFDLAAITTIGGFLLKTRKSFL